MQIQEGNVSDFTEEQAYLADCLKYIQTLRERLNQRISHMNIGMKNLKQSAYDEHMEYKSGANAADNAVVQHELWQQHLYLTDLEKESKNLVRLSSEPYFAALQFRFENEEEIETYHLGICSLMDEDTYQQWIIDWRSPIASLYYEGQIGPCTYRAADNDVHGTLVQKQQILIRRGRLLAIYNRCDLMNDQLLEWVLSQPASRHLQQIVATIQVEQNELIRAAEQQNLFISGIAGSGKSSIALHRVSYLLYLHRDWNSDSFLFISPNEQFAEYISELLPNLNDENISTITMDNLYRSLFLHKKLPFANFNYLPVAVEVKSLCSTFAFAEALQDFAVDYVHHNFCPHALNLDDLNVETSLLQDLYSREFSCEAMFKRPQLIFDYLQDILPGKAFTYQADEIKQELQNMLGESDLRVILQKFYQSRAFNSWLSSLSATEQKLIINKCASVSGRLDEIDKMVLAYMVVYFYQDYDTTLIKHLLVDEAQDLPATAHIILQDLYKVDKTICADFNQAISWNVPQNFMQELKEFYEKQKKLLFRQINVAYRSTAEITEFCRHFIPQTEVKAVPRHGQEVVIKKIESPAADNYGRNFIKSEIEKLYQDFCQAGQSLMSVAVILPNVQLVDEFRAFVQQTDLKACLVDNSELETDVTGFAVEKLLSCADAAPEENEFKLYILTPLQAKGREFDTVLVYLADSKFFPPEQAQKELYVACSRALHNLRVYYLSDASLLPKCS